MNLQEASSRPGLSASLVIPPSHQRLLSLTIAALGVVYGDIGTSPLYALRECFNPSLGLALDRLNVLGVLSLIIWSLLLVVTVKYLLFVMRADNDGEGGILALMALAEQGQGRIGVPGRLGVVTVLGLLGASFVYGDGVITPAISVLSAVEGLEVATAVFKPYVVPIALGVLLGLFLVQPRGTGQIGRIFGPVMLLWFSVLALLGIGSIMQTPAVLASINPAYAAAFLVHHAGQGFAVLGSVFLALTGAEALYADMGHFGKAPVRWGWYVGVLPALVVQYLGQGALLLREPGAVTNPFYLLAPDWFLYPMVALATAATVIASQAMLTGAFSLTQQAMQLGYLPRLALHHTSAAQIGQIYVPSINWLMLAGTLTLVATFQSSSNLAAAYGIAVSGTMVMSTLLIYVVARKIWGWRPSLAVGLVAFFLLIDLTFFTANVLKVPQGGWLPLVFGGLLFTLMTTWSGGRTLVLRSFWSGTPSLREFLADIRPQVSTVVPGTAVFMTQTPDSTPPALIQNLRHNHVLHQRMMFVTVTTERVPSVPCDEQVHVERLDQTVCRLTIRHGFMEAPDVPRILSTCSAFDDNLPLPTITFFFSRLTFLASPKPGMALWRERLFVFLARNSQRASSFFRIPAEQVIEIGAVVEI